MWVKPQHRPGTEGDILVLTAVKLMCVRGRAGGRIATQHRVGRRVRVPEAAGSLGSRWEEQVAVGAQWVLRALGRG